ncbi:glycosyl hydrolase family 43 [Motilibacter rhizosphaerae]|uniref:Glycosyl hydrolase family 43 n=1 Tax=Motilibacter rhizosphaerae TaxID=598652 RepID=A0A4Q7NNQ3_9ACTN|nr:glycoside hydrolase family 43 protein [Motilibacter rhizosphaerae]RZS86869.1 glycosyl hydrolase family 43 [Motilibacter rhizosphaerae]
MTTVQAGPVSARIPAWDGYCADPFALATPEGFVLYGTDPTVARDDPRVFCLLHSEDLRTWRHVGGALTRLADEPEGAEYWAPEVAHADGTYYLYYSVGAGEVGHALRVAASRSALGPFEDVGVVLTPGLPFAIDASPVQDADGSWWLYFATDHLAGPRPGTVIARARLHHMTELGPVEIVLTADADWQVYQRDRLIYGERRDWHTLEGPSLQYRQGRWWMLYSGGNWQGEGYGVGLAAAASLDGDWAPVGEGPSVLSSASGLLGPGHCSVLLAEGRDFLVFHAWDDARRLRRPHLAPLTWTEQGPVVELG